MSEAIESNRDVVPGPPGEAAIEVVSSVAGGGSDKVKKVIVAVHGVGDQHQYATIQAVVKQFCGFHGQPGAISLGSFHTGRAGFSIQKPFPTERFQHLAFAEVYWAKTPRDAVNDKHTLEEAKKWAGTIAERLRLRWQQAGSDPATEPNVALLKQVLDEMIETIAVLERLSYLGAKAGLGTFDLARLLDDYLGDVQIVAEFGKQRGEILKAFAEIMTAVHEAYPKAEIYVVAHSEGTVVSFLGLLEAGRKPKSPWIEQVRGFMTIGSPIDKHLILWPELFEPAGAGWNQPDGATKSVEPDERVADAPIEWRNYYDRGDPIGFTLNDARVWLQTQGWIETPDRPAGEPPRNPVFHFTEEHDFGFTRYPFPGKAHVDYWNDRQVFGHFIETVVKEPVPEPATANEKPAVTTRKTLPRDASAGPNDIRSAWWLSYLTPYLGVAAVLYLAVYVLFKAFTGYTSDPAELEIVYILRTVAAVTILLYGVTVTSRIPRLTRQRSWRQKAWLFYLISALIFFWLLPAGPSSFRSIGGTVVELPFGGSRVAIATVVVALVYLVSRRWPQWGLKPLLVVGAAGVAALIGLRIYDAYQSPLPDQGKLWPVFLAAAGFFYLWWLAALLFDLVFVWHVYIRQELALRRMDGMVGYRSRAPQASGDTSPANRKQA